MVTVERNNQHFKLLDLFAGVGGFSYAAHYLGFAETTQFVEINPYCQKVLNKNFPNIPVHADITTYHPQFREFDIITFGSPCQNFSSAGKRDGIHGDRSRLFFDAVRIVKQVQPISFVMENVIGIRKWQESVLSELHAIGGYNLYWFSISVKELGGCHKRDRWFCLGWRDDSYSYLSRTGRNATIKQENRATNKITPYSQSRRQEAQSRICGADDGISEKLDCLINQLMSPSESKTHIQNGTASDCEVISDRNKRIQALGNAVTPQQAGVCFHLLAQLIDIDN